MGISGWYYLHVDGDMIYNRDFPGIEAGFRESDLVKMFWSVDFTNRADAWKILVEGLAAGANVSRIIELAVHWRCDDVDAMRYAERTGVILERDGNAWCATRTDFVDPVESPCGYGDTCLEAMADLCKALGWVPLKLWGASFADLVK